MKNLFFVSLLFLIFSCGGEAKSDSNSDKTSSTENVEVKSNETPPQTSLDSEESKSALEENNNTEETTTVETPPKANKTSVPSNNNSAKKSTVSNKSDNTSVKNEAEAKAQMEEEKNRALAEKTRLEEEMKKAEAEKVAKEAAAAKRAAKEAATAKKAAEVAGKKKREKVGEVIGSGTSKPTKDVSLHDSFNDLLRKHVSSSGKVSYKGFKNDETTLNAYLSKLEKTRLENSWSRNKKMAFWINAYNAYTIKLILKNYPVKSIMDLHNGKPWDVKWIKLDGRTLSLNNIENDILRPTYKDARIHFAVNCAAKSCPPLLNKAWTESNLNSNFERQAKAFINNSNYNSISSNNVEVSKIFDWYKKDFGDLRTYLNKYSTTKISEGTSINYKSYDWNLNQ